MWDWLRFLLSWRLGRYEINEDPNENQYLYSKSTNVTDTVLLTGCVEYKLGKYNQLN